MTFIRIDDDLLINVSQLISIERYGSDMTRVQSIDGTEHVLDVPFDGVLETLTHYVRDDIKRAH